MYKQFYIGILIQNVGYWANLRNHRFQEGLNGQHF